MKKNTPDRERRVAEAGARIAGKAVLKYFGSKEKVVRKSPRELVTRADMESQSILISLLSREFPDHKIISEERKGHVVTDTPTWVLDPLDGTHNFISGVPFFGISIALLVRKKCILGVIYLPYEGTLFSAMKGNGAFRNGTRIGVSKNAELSKAMITYDNRFYANKSALENYKKLVGKAFSTRIFGSAVRDLCFVAEGVMDGRIWNTAKLYDVAAGSLIVQEAGGRVTDFEGQSIGPESEQVVASNGRVHGQLLRALT